MILIAGILCGIGPSGCIWWVTVDGGTETSRPDAMDSGETAAPEQGCGSSGTLSSVLASSATGGGLGYSVAFAGDVNIDGYADVLVGAPHDGAESGAAYLYLGGESGLGSGQTFVTSGSEDAYLGISVIGAGDLNADGYEDVVVAAPGEDDLAGAIYVFAFDSRGIVHSYITRISGEAAGDRFGWAMAALGDIDDNGFGDVVVGADRANDGSGAAYVFAARETRLEEADASGFGASVTDAGDLDGDGGEDLAVGAPLTNSGQGMVYVYRYDGAGYSESVATSLSGKADGDYFGSSLGASDVNGDGYTDLLVGAPEASQSTGSVAIFSGAYGGVETRPLTILEGPAENARFGVDVFGPGDMNGDGRGEVLVSAPDANEDKGAVYLYEGATSDSLEPTSSYESSSTGTEFGQSVAGGGDINGDGCGDLLIGAPEAGDGGEVQVILSNL